MIMSLEMKDTRLLFDFDLRRMRKQKKRGTGPAVDWIVIIDEEKHVIIDEEKQRGTAFSLLLLCTS